MAKEITYKQGDQELRAERILSKAELLQHFEPGIVKLIILIPRRTLRKPHTPHGGYGVKRTRWKQKSKEVTLY